jgi:transposase
MRRDLNAVGPGEEITVELKMLTARRADLVADRTRGVNRLREQLLPSSPPWSGASTTATARAR